MGDLAINYQIVLWKKERKIWSIIVKGVEALTHTHYGPNPEHPVVMTLLINRKSEDIFDPFSPRNISSQLWRLSCMLPFSSLEIVRKLSLCACKTAFEWNMLEAHWCCWIETVKLCVNFCHLVKWCPISEWTVLILPIQPLMTQITSQKQMMFLVTLDLWNVPVFKMPHEHQVMRRSHQGWLGVLWRIHLSFRMFLNLIKHKLLKLSEFVG